MFVFMVFDGGVIIFLIFNLYVYVGYGWGMSVFVNAIGVDV